MTEDKPKEGGTGVWLPPSVTSRIQRKTAANGTDATSPAHTPVSSRSSSFSSSTSSAPCAPGLGRPPYHNAGTCPAPRAVASTPQLGQHVSTARRPPCSAGDAQVRPAQAGYGRFSLDHASAVQICAGQHMQSCTGGAWPAGVALCNSLSVPAPLNAVSSAAMGQVPAGIVLQDDMSWASTVSGDMVMLPAGADAAVLATAQQLQLAQQREHECQLMQAQQEQQLLLAQQQRDRQLLLSELGSVSAAPSNLAQDGALLAQLQCNSALPAAPPPGRRASMSCYMQLPASNMCLDARACSVPLGGPQMPQFAAATSPLPGIGAAADLADAADNALEAELDAALQQLLAMRNEVELKKARAKQARASMDSCRSLTPIPMPQAPQVPAVTSGMCSAAAVLSSQLYQPFAALNCAPSGSSFSVPQMAAVQGAPGACAPIASQHTSFSGFAPVTGYTSVPDSFGLPARSLQATAVSVLGLNAGTPLHASLDGQPLRTEGTLADWIACNPGAGLSAQQAAVQANLQLLGLR